MGSFEVSDLISGGWIFCYWPLFSTTSEYFCWNSIHWDEMNIWWGQTRICQTMKRQKLEKLVTSASEASVAGLSQLHQSFCSTPVWGLSASLDSTQKMQRTQCFKMSLISRSCTQATFNPWFWLLPLPFGPTKKKAIEVKLGCGSANYLGYLYF